MADLLYVVMLGRESSTAQTNLSRKTFLKNARTYLKKVEVVVTSYIGVPANTPREIVDNSYTFSLVVTFKNKEDQDIYQTHPAHVKFVEDTSDLWNKVQIYDSLKV